MLQIRLSRGPSAESGGGTKSLPVETVTVACPDHLILADLPVAKSVGSVTAASLLKTVGRRSRRHLGERVHFCVRCDFPIAIYGRLSPCEHAFCLDCARSDSICYLCDERIQKIQTIKLMEGIFICAAPHCLKSFLRRTEFESHIHENHADLLQPNMEKDDGNESEVQSVKQSTASESFVKAPLRPVFSPSTHSLPQDREDRGRHQQPRESSLPRPMMQSRPSPHFGQGKSHPSDQQADSQPPSFERVGSQNSFQHQGVNMQGGLQQGSGQFSDKQQGMTADTQFPEFPPQHPQQTPNFVMPNQSNPSFSYPPLPEGVQPFYGAPPEMAEPDSAPESGSEQGSLLGFLPGPANFSETYQRPWNLGPTGLPIEIPLGGQGTADASIISADSQRVPFFVGDYGRNPEGFPMNPIPPPWPDKGMERQCSNVMEPRDGTGTFALQPATLPPLPPPPLPPPHTSDNQGNSYPGNMGHDGQGFGW